MMKCLKLIYKILILKLKIILLNNEDDFDRGKGKFIIQN